MEAHYFYRSLFDAIKANEFDTVKHLLTNKSDIDFDVYFSKRITPITLAIKSGPHYDLVELLVDIGFNVNIPKLHSPLFLALRKKNVKLVEILAKRKSELFINKNLISLCVNARNRKIGDLLTSASIHGKSNIEETLRAAIFSRSYRRWIHKYEDGCYEFYGSANGPFTQLMETFFEDDYEREEVKLVSISVDEFVDIILKLREKMTFEGHLCDAPIILHELIFTYFYFKNLHLSHICEKLIDYFRSNQIECNLNYKFYT
ncbi:hypothetical protein B4U80_14275, partial [Leptotrombidium deliense]